MGQHYHYPMICFKSVSDEGEGTQRANQLLAGAVSSVDMTLSDIRSQLLKLKQPSNCNPGTWQESDWQMLRPG